MSPTTFLTLPSEIRLAIYDILLTNHQHKVLNIRSEDPAKYELNKEEQCRTPYRIMSDRFRSRSIETSYTLLFNPGIYASILSVNKQIHQEAAHVLYSSHIFDFYTDIESVVPFLSDLTPSTRTSIKRINITKRALPYVKNFDSCEWRSVCEFVSKNMKLTQLGLGILGGKTAIPYSEGDIYAKSDFSTITTFEGMDWVTQLAAIKGLENLDVKAHLQHCPVPVSNAMAFFVNFSASIEYGFAEYLRELMVVRTV